MTDPAARQRRTVSAHPVAATAITVLFAANLFCILYTPLYSSVTPKIGPWPFFYFYLLVFTVVTSLVLWAITWLKRPMAPAQGRPTADGSEVAR
jgi:phosphoglycerol transferase MdoB-like AlkP superfamily enzyme